MSDTNVFSRGVVRVNKHRCDTCIFGPYSPVPRSRLDEMLRDCTADAGVIPCHHTLDHDEQAVCNGFFLQGDSVVLRLTEVMQIIEWATPERWRS